MAKHRPDSTKEIDSLWDELEGPRPRRRLTLGLRRLSLVEWLVIASIIGMLVALLMPAGDQDYRPRFPPPPAAPARLVSCAGEYFMGGRGRSLHLRILADGRYSYIWGGCCGVCERESGYAREVGGLIVFQPTTTRTMRMKHVFVPIRWGERSYLVPPEQMSRFCEAVAIGDEPRREFAGRYYRTVAATPATGVPQLPQPWAAYLGQRLVLGNVVAVIDRTTVRVDIGSNQGVERDSTLALQGWSAYTKHLAVTEVEPAACVARLKEFDEGEAHLVVGLTVVGPKAAP